MSVWLKIIVMAITIFVIISGCGSSSSPSNGENNIPDRINENNDTNQSTVDANQTDQTNLDDGNVSSTNAETCFTIPRLGTGDVFTIRNIDSVNNNTVEIETTITSFSSTSADYATVTTGAFSATGTKTNTFTIGTNYIDITRTETTDTSTVVGITVSTDTTLVYDPYLRVPFDTVCEGDVTTSGFTLTTTVSPGGSFSSSQTRTTTIESVNDTKTIAMGTFDAVRMRIEDGDSTLTKWIDKGSGRDLYGEDKDASGQIISTQELIYHN